MKDTLRVTELNQHTVHSGTVVALFFPVWNREDPGNCYYGPVPFVGTVQWVHGSWEVDLNRMWGWSPYWEQKAGWVELWQDTQLVRRTYQPGCAHLQAQG